MFPLRKHYTKNFIMTKIIIILGLLSSLVGGFIYLRYQFKKTGHNEQKLKNAEGAIDNVKKANSVKHDGSFDDKLRDKYRR